MEPQNCRHCGKGIEGGGLYCPECQALSGGSRPRRFRIFSLFFSVLLLFLTGMLLWHGGLGSWSFSLDSLLRRRVAVINGEAITRSDLSGKMKNIRSMVERQYGKEVFAGERGRALLANLEREVLEEMVMERLLVQEARQLRVQISDQQVRQELQRISQEIYGTWENFQARMKEDGFQPEELQEYIRNILLFKAVKAAKAAPGSDPEASFNLWLVQAKQKADVAVYLPSSPAFSSGASCCSPGGGCGGQPGVGGPVDPQTEKEASRVALEAYRNLNSAEKDMTAKVTDYGCHIQVDIQKDGRVVKSYTYWSGQVFEIS